MIMPVVGLNPIKAVSANEKTQQIGEVVDNFSLDSTWSPMPAAAQQHTKKTETEISLKPLAVDRRSVGTRTRWRAPTPQYSVRYGAIEQFLRSFAHAEERCQV